MILAVGTILENRYRIDQLMGYGGMGALYRAYDTHLQRVVAIKENTITRPLISQLIRSATSVGANYCEANNASSKKDFRNKIFICKKEAQETKYWLELLKTAWPERKDEINDLFQECHEFVLIFQKIITTLKINEN